MTITANYIDTGTIQITNYWEPTTGNAATYHTFNDLAKTISDAITGTASGNAGATSGITFTVSAGITPIASTGWTLADSFWGYNTKTTTRDATTASPIFTQVFKSPCADGNSTKNIIVRYNTLTQEILTTTCEKYTVATRAITNEAYTFMDCAPVHYNLSYSDVIIMVNPRFLVFHSYIATAPDLWSGVFECAREDVNDVAGSGYPDTNSTGYPCWGWMGSTSMGLGALIETGKTFGTDGVNAGPLWSMPRTVGGNTGISAAINYAVNLGIDTYPSPQAVTTYNLTNSALRPVNRAIVDTTKFTSNKWSVNKLILPIKPIVGFKDAQSGNYGQLYGIKMLAPIGYNMNQINVTVDSDNNGSATGTSKRHWLLNTHQKLPLVNNYRDSGQWVTDLVTTNGSLKGVRHISIGSAIYIIGSNTAITNNGGVLQKFNRFTRVMTTLSLGGNNSQIYDIVFDGERYIYFTRGSAIIYRFDITTETLSSLSVAANIGFLGINGNAVYASLATDTASSYMFRFTRQASSGTVNGIAAHPTTPTTVTTLSSGSSRQFGMRSDFDGRMYYMSTASADYRLQYLSETGTAPTTLFTSNSYAFMNYLILDGKSILVIANNSSSTCTVNMFYNAPSGSNYNSSSPPSGMANGRGDSGMFKYHGMTVVCNNGANNQNYFIQHLSIVNSSIYNSENCFMVTSTANENYPAGSIQDTYTTTTKSYGAEIMASTQYGVNVFQNINGDASIGSFTAFANKLAQVAIPA
jgi:hypothetical protein